MPLLLRPSSEISIHSFGDGGVLFLNGSRRIWVLNSTSAFIWCLLDEIDSLDGLACRVATTFHIDKPKALHDVNAIMSVFEREGLFDTKAHAESIETDGNWDITPIGPMISEPDNWAIKGYFRIANHLFEFCCQDTSMGNSFTSIMKHMATNSGGRPDTRIAVASGTGGAKTWDVFLDDLGFSLGLADDEVLPQLATLFFVRSCEALKDRLLFHAAVIEMGETTVMFPGEAGSGKTTLTAALLMNGSRYYSDELAVINVDDLHVSPLPLPMSIKPGSVKPLERYYPGLKHRHIHRRSDGKMVRYLSPSPHNLPTGERSSQIDVLIFPKYIEGIENRMVALNKTEALRRLARTGSSNRVFTNRDVGAMIALIERKPCYEMRFSDLHQAVSQLKNLAASFEESSTVRNSV